MTDSKALSINRRINQLSFVGERLDHAQRHVLASKCDDWLLPIALPGTRDMLPLPVTRDQAIDILGRLAKATFTNLQCLYADLVELAEELVELAEETDEGSNG